MILKSAPPTLVSLFTGAGGLDIGLERAGFRTVAATDFDEDCIATLEESQKKRIPVRGDGARLHLEGTRILKADVADLTPQDLDLGPESKVDVVIGGPPCQPFSSAGTQLGFKDPRGTLFEHFARLVGQIRPKMFLFENVRGLATARGPSQVPGEALHLVREAFEERGYSTRCVLLNSADFGSYQRRVRLFMIGSRLPVLPDFPNPTHSQYFTGDSLLGTRPWRTLGEFLASRPSPMEAEIVRPSYLLLEQLRELSSGSGLKSQGVKEATRPGGHWGYKQGTFIADPAKPSRTVTAASTQDWIRLSDGSLRRLTLSECAALQGFPEDWQFQGSKATKFRQVGNAVPSVFGEVIGAQLMASLSDVEIGTTSQARASSVPLPKQIVESIRYTIRDEARNGKARPRSRMYQEQ